MQIKLLIVLAIKELGHDWRTSGVLLCVVISIVAPLLILFGLKQGVIQTQRDLLLNDPCNLEIRMIGHYDLTSDWLLEMKQNPLVQFVVPLNRFLNMDINVIDERGKSRTVDLIPTGSKDPLLLMTGLEAPRQNNQVLITHALAKRMHYLKGDKIHTLLKRIDDNRLSQQKQTDLTIIGILPIYECMQKSAIIVTQSLLHNFEAYKEGSLNEIVDSSHLMIKNKKRLIEPKYGISSLLEENTCLHPDMLLTTLFRTEYSLNINDWFVAEKSKGNIFLPYKNKGSILVKKNHFFAKARIFAKNLDDVIILSDQLHTGEHSIELVSKAADIVKLKKLNQFLNILLGIIAAIVILGGGLVLAGVFLITIHHKRIQFAQMRLLGIAKKQIRILLFIQGTIIATVAFIVSVGLSSAANLTLSGFGRDSLAQLMLANSTEMTLFYLQWSDYFIAYGGILFFSLSVISLGVYQANAIDAGERLREL